MGKHYYVYIATNVHNTVLYTGVTNNLERRMHEHTNKLTYGFTSKYNVNKLVWYEEFSSPQEAIAAEKRIKGWRREKKLRLIKDLNHDFFGPFKIEIPLPDVPSGLGMTEFYTY